MAYEFYISIEGSKQGKFKGESARERWKDKTAGIGFSYEVNNTSDAASGFPIGRRQHKPITIVKQWGAASPQIFQALVSGESLKTVLFEFIKTSAEGEEQVYYTIKLTNATIASYRPSISPANFNSYQLHELEEVSFSFQKIEIESKVGKTMAMDELRSR